MMAVVTFACMQLRKYSDPLACTKLDKAEIIAIDKAKGLD